MPAGWAINSGGNCNWIPSSPRAWAIQSRYGQAQRIWVMDRGIPTEAVLTELRQPETKISYLVGTPKGRLTKLEAELAAKPWQEVRPQLRVKLLPQEGNGA